jgi:hypothetical protein
VEDVASLASAASQLSSDSLFSGPRLSGSAVSEPLQKCVNTIGSHLINAQNLIFQRQKKEAFFY